MSYYYYQSDRISALIEQARRTNDWAFQIRENDLRWRAQNAQLAADQAAVVAQEKALRHKELRRKEAKAVKVLLTLSRWAVEHPEDVRRLAGGAKGWIKAAQNFAPDSPRSAHVPPPNDSGTRPPTESGQGIEERVCKIARTSNGTYSTST